MTTTIRPWTEAAREAHAANETAIPSNAELHWLASALYCGLSSAVAVAEDPATRGSLIRAHDALGKVLRHINSSRLHEYENAGNR